jgi:hypothetical protein
VKYGPITLAEAWPEPYVTQSHPYIIPEQYLGSGKRLDGIWL